MSGSPTPKAAHQPRRAVILTALPVEYLAVRDHLDAPKEKTHKGTVYEIGKFGSPEAPWEILIAEIGAGNPGAAAEAERAIEYFQPQVALFVGVAGGLKDVNLGDVVAATKVYGYESGKVGQAFQPRADSFNSDHGLSQRARAEARNQCWQTRIKGAEALPPPRAFVRPIVAGEKVVADTQAEIYKFIKDNFGDALAVEMEGLGFLTAVHACPSVKALVIRGISDLVHDKSAEDEAQRQDAASRHAAAFTFEVLANLSIGAQEKAQPKSSQIWNVPHNRNPHFTGRGELLENLLTALVQGQGAALTQTFSGLGGVGKTQMAVEYAYRFRKEYDLIWWVKAEDAVSLSGDFAALAEKLGSPKTQEEKAMVAEVRRWLEEHSGWLLIFDNANEPKDLKEYKPQGGQGHVIITSRNPAWGGVGQVVPVPVWAREEAVDFLLKRTGQEEAVVAAELAEELGYLPLALEQAGAYIDECGCIIAQYLDLFRSRRQGLLKLGKLSQDYPDSVATTWELSFQKVQKESPVAADLLNLCAFLAPDDIPKGLLVKGAEQLPPRLAQAVTDPLALNSALAALRRYSLIEVGEDSLAVHRLVQAVVRDLLDEEEKKDWSGAAVDLVDAAFPPGNFDRQPETWPWCSNLLPHALTSAGHAETLWVALEAASKSLNRAGFYLSIRAEFAEARKAYERSLSMAEAAYGSDHPNVANRLNNLGSVLQDQGDLAGAKAYYERALTIDEAAYGPDHPTVAIRLNNLGLVLRAQGDLAGAKSHYERALAIDEAAYGPDHPKVAIRLNNLGYVLRAQGDLVGAKSHCERALSIDEAAYGPDHPVVAIRMNNLGGVLRAQGDLLGAQSHYERALSISEAAFGPNHPTVAVRLNNLGAVLRSMGDLEGAKSHSERALRIFRQFLGDDHPTTKLVKRNLASLGLPEK